jgi:hypothetical protein
MSDDTSAEMKADTNGPRQVTSGDYDPGAPWQFKGDWDTYYRIGLLLTLEGD